VACQLAAHMRQPKDMCHMTREQYQAAAVRIHGQSLWVPHPGVRVARSVHPIILPAEGLEPGRTHCGLRYVEHALLPAKIAFLACAFAHVA